MKLDKPEEVKAYIEKLQSSFDSVSDSDIEFENAASVLYWFDPLELYPFNSYVASDIHMEKGWLDFFKYCDPVQNKNGQNLWQLQMSFRRKALMRLFSIDQLQNALDCNKDRQLSDEQILFEQILRNTDISIESLNREMLVVYSEILGWLKDIIPGIDEKIQKIEMAIPMADLLSSMYRLTGDFVGRKNELEQLAKYVGLNPDYNSKSVGISRFLPKLNKDQDNSNILLIYGPGGVGKSTLLSKFIINNVNLKENEVLPFAYLDIDKAIVDLEWPESFIVEASRQLSTQLREHKNTLLSLKEELERLRGKFDDLEVSKSFYYTESFTARFGEIINTIPKPVIFIVDTFEEAQFLGKDVVNVVWKLLMSLQNAAQNLRIIVVGRSTIKDFPVTEVRLNELSRVEATEMLNKEILKFEGSEKTRVEIIDEIIKIAGLNPMSLRLALTIVKEQGVSHLKKIDTKNLFFRRLREEVIQARLYGRILSHIHNPDIRKLAQPGLIVRRISPDIIYYVLAGPCQINVDSLNTANNLFGDLSKEGALMEPDKETGELIHRADVRKLMLDDLKSEVSAETIRQIHDAAIAYYEQKNGSICRSEEIYHRLLRGDDLELINSRWEEGVQSRLRNALEELPADARIWLSGKLGVTPDGELLKKAGLEKWEEITARTAQRLLLNRESDNAIELMRERKERSPGSPLYRLELEALRTQGLYQEALFTVNEALSTLPASSSPEFTRLLFYQATLIYEAMGQVNEAIDYIKNTEKLLQFPLSDNIEAIRIYITHIRLLRKKGDREEENKERAGLIKVVVRLIIQNGERLSDQDIDDLIQKKAEYSLSAEVSDALRNTPALIQEMVAELGKVIPHLIPLALEYIGIDLRNDTQKNMLAKAFHDWNIELLSFSNSGEGELVERSGISKNDLTSWLNYINSNTGKSLGSAIYNWKYEVISNDLKKQSAYNFDKILVDISRNNVDISINKEIE